MLGQLRQAIAPSLYPVTVDWGLEAEGENCQVPRVVPAIFHGSRLSLFRIFAGDVKVGRKVVLKAGNTEQELELDKEPRLSGELLHKMFARRMIQELEEEPHLGDSERDLIKDMSLKYNIMSSFTSFIAVDERSEKKEDVGEMLVRRVDNMIPHGFGGIQQIDPLSLQKMRLTDAAFGSDSDSDDEMEFGLFDGEVVIPPQRKTGGRGEHIDLEQRFRVKFNDAGEILLITQYHFCQKKKKKRHS